MDQPTLPAGSCGTCPSQAGHYCAPCWLGFSSEQKSQVVRCREATRGTSSSTPTVSAPDAATEVAPRPAAPPARLVCREHHKPVTWRARFRGCTRCINPRKAA